MNESEALADLIRWVEVWDRVCNAAWGDDDKPAPSWEAVVDAELSDWNDIEGIKKRGADYWSGYMEARAWALRRQLPLRDRQASKRGLRINRA